MKCEYCNQEIADSEHYIFYLKLNWHEQCFYEHCIIKFNAIEKQRGFEEFEED